MSAGLKGGKQPYQRPCLRAFGDISRLTASGSNGMIETNASMMAAGCMADAKKRPCL